MDFKQQFGEYPTNFNVRHTVLRTGKMQLHNRYFEHDLWRINYNFSKTAPVVMDIK